MRSAVALVLLFLSWADVIGQTRISLDSAAHVYRDTNEVLVTAIRGGARKSSVPYSVAEIDAPPTTSDRTIASILHGLPGLQVSDRFNFAVGERITNRGFGARTQFGVRGVRILEDGMPLTFADGQSALESIDPQELSSAELLSGPGSALYGNAAGGVLLLSSQPLAIMQGRIIASGSTGANGLRQYNLSTKGHIGEPLFSASYSHLSYDGFRDHSSASVLRGGVRASYESLNVSARYTEFHALSPGALTQKEFDSDITIAAASSIKADARKDGHQSQLAADWLYGSDSANVKFSAYAIGRSLTNPIVGKITDLSRMAGGGQIVYSSKADRALSILPIDWNAGFQLDLMNDDRTSFVNNAGQKAALTLDQNERVTTTALFAAASVAPVSDVTAMLAARYDRTHFGVTDHFITSTDPNDTGDRTMDAFSPSAGIIWRLARKVQLFANVSTSFETPTTTELSNRESGAGGFNPDLQPQRATGFEAGFRSRPAWWLTVDASAYLTNIRGELIGFELPASPGRSYYRNAGTSRHQGCEASLTALLLDSIDIRAAFSYIDARYEDYVAQSTDFSGNRVPGVAPTVIDVSITYHLPWAMFATGHVSSLGRVYTNDANTVSAAPYTIADITVGSEGVYVPALMTTLSIAAGVENLFDRKYSSSVVVNAAANRYFEPGSRRAFWVAASIRLFPERERGL